MNEEAIIDLPEVFTPTAVPLLREYLTKFGKLKDRLARLSLMPQLQVMQVDRKQKIINVEYDILMRLFDRLKPAAHDLAQQVSGMIDQGKITPLERVELRLRLAEFESILIDLPKLFQAYRPT